jgi:hypothetical protein
VSGQIVFLATHFSDNFVFSDTTFLDNFVFFGQLCLFWTICTFRQIVLSANTFLDNLSFLDNFFFLDNFVLFQGGGRIDRSFFHRVLQQSGGNSGALTSASIDSLFDAFRAKERGKLIRCFFVLNRWLYGYKDTDRKHFHFSWEIIPNIILSNIKHVLSNMFYQNIFSQNIFSQNIFFKHHLSKK